MNFLEKVDKYSDAGQLPPKIADTLRQFYNSYKKAVEQNRGQIETCHPVLNQFLDEIIAQLKSPFMFSPNHQKIISPFDYFQFGKDFIRPLVQLESSKVLGLDRVNEIESHLARGENVVLFANHQTEPDPQAINLLLENTHPELTKKMIVVAGHRVTTDPLAVPLSKGLNL
ncbi:MAG: 1-acyl-sn-glycerol-3-phosphate acyltransferase, partial [bacterium]